MYDNETRLIDITVDELKRIIFKAVREQGIQLYRYIDSCMAAQQDGDQGDAEQLTGIAGMVEALHCSKTKVQRMKREGLLEGGYTQIGKTIIVSNPRALREAAARNIEARKRQKRYRQATASIINQTNI